MNAVIKLGNAENPNNDIPIKDASVSYDHLEIVWIDESNVRITDVGSKNFTKVNGRRIISQIIKPNDTVEIGRNTLTGAEIISKTKVCINKNKIRFYNEFEALQPFFKEYQKQLKKLNGAHKIKINVLRGVIIAGALLLFLLLKEKMGIPEWVRFLVLAVGGSIAAIFAEKLFSTADMRLRQKELEEEYLTKLACPKCNYPLTKHTYTHWKRTRKCPKCQANWVK